MNLKDDKLGFSHVAVYISKCSCNMHVLLASFPGLPWLQFLITYGMQKSMLLPPFLHTASDQKLEPGKAWERGYVLPLTS